MLELEDNEIYDKVENKIKKRLNIIEKKLQIRNMTNLQFLFMYDIIAPNKKGG